MIYNISFECYPYRLERLTFIENLIAYLISLGYKQKEVAKIMNWSYERVRKLTMKIRRRLKNE